jgi:hypothetical protein
MSTQKSQVNAYGRYVGRVGALAAALGIGVIGVTSPGIANADSTGSSSSSSNDSSTSSSNGAASTGSQTTTTGSTQTPGSTTTGTQGPAASSGSTSTGSTTSTESTKSSGTTSSTTQVGSGVTISSSGGAHTSTESEGSTTGNSTPTTGTSTASSATGTGTQTESTQTATAAKTPETTPTTGSSTAPTASSTQPTTVTAKTGSSSSHSTTAEAAAATSETTPSPTAPSSTIAAKTAPATITGSSAAESISNVATAATTFAAATETSALVTPSVVPAAPTAPIVAPVVGVIGFLNNVVSTLLSPFLAPAPATPEPFTPVVWAVLGWVRRNLFNQSPTINYDPTTTVQTGQTVTGNIGATDPEGDPLTYTVTQAPTNGTLTIDQTTGKYSYTPNDIDYSGTQTDSFTVSATDGKTNLLSLFGQPHSAQTTIGVTVHPPTATRTILTMPAGVTNPTAASFSPDGKSVIFTGTTAGDTRTEIYQMNVDGTNSTCLSCGVSPTTTANLSFASEFGDGSGRYLVAVADPTGRTSGTYDVLETKAAGGSQLVPIKTPQDASFVLDPQRGMVISPDGTKVGFSQFELGASNYVAVVPVVGNLVRSTNATTGAPEYDITDARVIADTGEVKDFTPDGKGIMVNAGQYIAGTADDEEVDLATGKVTRLTANEDYTEDIEESPNEQWILVGSGRGDNMLTPMSEIERPAFLPSYVVGPVYTAYSTGVNVTNQDWIIANSDELNGENGLPLFVNDDGYVSRSGATWNADGSQVAFVETNATDPADSRIVISNLQYTTSVGPVAGDSTSPAIGDWAPKLSTYVPTAPALPPAGTYAGAGGGTATVVDTPDPAKPGYTIRTVTYTNYVNQKGEILNGTESTDSNATQLSIQYNANIQVTGTHTGSLTANATVTNRQTLTGYVTSTVDGVAQTLNDPANIAAAKSSV